MLRGVRSDPLVETEQRVGKIEEPCWCHEGSFFGVETESPVCGLCNCGCDGIVAAADPDIDNLETVHKVQELCRGYLAGIFNRCQLLPCFATEIGALTFWFLPGLTRGQLG